jgi:hypothetical protein
MKKILRIIRNIVIHDEGRWLTDFSKTHPDLNIYEKTLIDVTAKKLENPKVSQQKEVYVVIDSLRKLSLSGNLSDDGKTLLAKLNRRQWIMILPYAAPFFGR